MKDQARGNSGVLLATSGPATKVLVEDLYRV